MGVWARCVALAAVLTTVHAYVPLSDLSLQHLVFPEKDFDVKDGKLLAPILRPRVPGTPDIEAVREHFVDFWRTTLPQWSMDMHNSTMITPVKGGSEIDFVNLIFRRTPPDVEESDVSYLTIAAHYDSKMTPDGFIGATDSAAPCAMLMHVARAVDEALSNKWKAEGVGDLSGGTEAPKGLQVLLLDGEEAFQSWTDTDSIYGARALAEDWEMKVHPFWGTYRNPLDQISLFVLLDLLGLENPEVPSYFKTTHWAYQRFADAEKRLRSLNLLRSRHPDKKPKDTPFLKEHDKDDDSRWLGGYIGDDHTPFLQRGVEILHMIPHPFPWVWHKIDDDADHLDFNTTQDWAVLTTAFVAEWMELEDYMDHGPPPAKATAITDEKPPRNVGRDEL